MLQCITCSCKINKQNTPTLHKGRTLSGGITCTSCHSKLLQSSLEVALSIPYLTDTEVINYFSITLPVKSSSFSENMQIAS